MNTLYIVVPCYNEHECLKDSSSQLKQVLSNLIAENKISQESRIVLVDDGSNDNTWEIISTLNEEDKSFVGVKLSRNKGHQNAVMAGLTYACEKCDMTITIDADLQDDIEVIKDMVEDYHQGNEIVYGVRKARTTDSKFKRGTANLYYKILRKMGVDIFDNHADFRLMSQKACKCLLSYNEVNLFLRGIVPQIGLKHSFVKYDRKARTAGESKYTLKKMLALAIDGITSFSLKPLQFITFLGNFMIITSLLIIIVFSILFLCHVLAASYSFYILLSIYLVGGIILTMMGILGTYVGKTYMEVKSRPRFFIEEVKE